jgi:Tfp pilus assembly protein PilX
MMLLIAALIAGVFSAVTEETRIGAAATERELALLCAESAIESGITALTVSLEDSMSVGETRSGPIEGLGMPVALHATRLGASRYWLVAEAGGASSGSGIVRRIGVVVRATNAPDGSITIDRIPERAWSELF